MRKDVDKIVLTGLFIAIGVILPTFFASQELATKFSPMHIPVFLCGAILGWKYGLLSGVVTPLLRSLLLSMPPLFPVALSMAFELGAYGATMGLLYYYFRPFKNNLINIYISLILSMILGRLVYGIFNATYLGISGNSFVLKTYLASIIVNVIPGIVTHLLIVPAILKVFEDRQIIKFK